MSYSVATTMVQIILPFYQSQYDVSLLNEPCQLQCTVFTHCVPGSPSRHLESCYLILRLLDVAHTTVQHYTIL